MFNELFNWLTMVEIPVFFALFRMLIKLRNDMEDAVATSRNHGEKGIASVREALSDFKLHVARNYVSTAYLKDVETRITDHLLRIEKKLDDVGRRQ